MPLGCTSRRQRHGGVQKLIFLVVAALALVMMTTMTDVHAATMSRSDVASTVRADSNVNDDSSSSTATSTSSSNAELRSLGFQDALENAWDLLSTRTLRPKSSSTSTANEADDEPEASTSDDNESTASSTSTTAAPIKAESLSLSADDAVTEALKTVTPTVTPAGVAATVIATATPTPITTPVVTPAPVSATPAPVPSPVQQKGTLTPTPTPAPSPSPTASDDGSEVGAETVSPQSNVDTEQLVKNVNIKSGSAKTNFDETIVVMILGGVGLIGVVVLVMSRKISKETGDDEAIRRASSFGIARL